MLRKRTRASYIWRSVRSTKCRRRCVTNTHSHTHSPTGLGKRGFFFLSFFHSCRPPLLAATPPVGRVSVRVGFSSFRYFLLVSNDLTLVIIIGRRREDKKKKKNGENGRPRTRWWGSRKERGCQT